MCPVRTHVAEKHEAAREAYMVWMDMGKPKSGHYVDNRRSTRATFTLALRQCRNHTEELKADACAENAFKKDSRKFWNSVHKVSNNKATCHAISVGSATGPENVATMWKEDFEKLYNSNVGNKYHNVFEQKIKNLPYLSFTSLISVMDVWDGGYYIYAEVW